MIDAKTKEKLRTVFYPKAERVVFEPVRNALEKHLPPEARVLDAGCGEGTWILREFRNKIGYLVGVDAQIPRDKKRMDEFILCNLENIPLADGTFDVIICYFVIEHLKQPQKVFAEFSRLLADDGVIIFRTPNIVSPLFVLSRLTSIHWHNAIKRVMVGSQGVDAFPTFYKCNTVGKLKRELKAAGLHRGVLDSCEQIQGYFTFSRISYAIGLLVSRAIQSCPLTKPFRSQLIGVYLKQAGNDTARENSPDNMRRQAYIA